MLRLLRLSMLSIPRIICTSIQTFDTMASSLSTKETSRTIPTGSHVEQKIWDNCNFMSKFHQVWMRQPPQKKTTLWLNSGQMLSSLHLHHHRSRLRRAPNGHSSDRQWHLLTFLCFVMCWLYNLYVCLNILFMQIYLFIFKKHRSYYLSIHVSI